MKKGILIVSFGTSHLDTLEKTIAVIEREAAEKFPRAGVYRAFTSSVIIRKLKRTAGLAVDTVGEALERMAADGVEEVIVQPTHIINGIENDAMMESLMEHMGLFRQIRAGKPLLSTVDDYKKSVHAVMTETELDPDEMLVLMGHGQVLVGTVESFPELNNVMARLEISGKKKAVLMPFMLVAGDHAKNDMAGEEDSWKSRLEEEGYEVRVILKGLGELEGIRKIFLEHIEEAAEG